MGLRLETTILNKDAGLICVKAARTGSLARLERSRRPICTAETSPKPSSIRSSPSWFRAKHQGDDIEMVTGRHKDHGEVVLIRDATRCMVLVDEPAHLDAAHADSSKSDGAIVERAMRSRQ